MNNLADTWNTIVFGWDVWKWMTLAPVLLAVARILWKVGGWVFPSTPDGEKYLSKRERADRAAREHETIRRHKNQVSSKRVEEKVHGVAPETKVKLTREQRKHRKALIEAAKSYDEARKHPKARFLVSYHGGGDRAVMEGGPEDITPGELTLLLDRKRTYRKGDLVVDTFHHLAYSCLGHGKWMLVDWSDGMFRVGKGVTYPSGFGNRRERLHVRKIYDVTDGGFAPRERVGDLRFDAGCRMTRIWNGHFWWAPARPADFMETRPNSRAHPDDVHHFVADERRAVERPPASTSRAKGKYRDRIKGEFVTAAARHKQAEREARQKARETLYGVERVAAARGGMPENPKTGDSYFHEVHAAFYTWGAKGWRDMNGRSPKELDRLIDEAESRAEARDNHRLDAMKYATGGLVRPHKLGDGMRAFHGGGPPYKLGDLGCGHENGPETVVPLKRTTSGRLSSASPNWKNGSKGISPAHERPKPVVTNLINDLSEEAASQMAKQIAKAIDSDILAGLPEPRLKPETMEEMSARVSTTIRETAKKFDSFDVTVKEAGEAIRKIGEAVRRS